MEEIKSSSTWVRTVFVTTYNTIINIFYMSRASMVMPTRRHPLAMACWPGTVGDQIRWKYKPLPLSIITIITSTTPPSQPPLQQGTNWKHTLLPSTPASSPSALQSANEPTFLSSVDTFSSDIAAIWRYLVDNNMNLHPSGDKRF